MSFNARSTDSGYFEVDVKCPICGRSWTFYCEDKSMIPEDGYLTCSPCVFDEHKESENMDIYPGE